MLILVRNYLIHVAINMVVMGLFGWQALTGIQTVQNILASMNAPFAQL
ncbi:MULTISPECIES: hypothetical protein [Pseudanabaena]|jgi:hypothetical protein|nr:MULTISPECIES: hypothetical protein [Pseudanabaena]MEA5486719.1 hypothetical protein [Pseudanabaena sp. CCNP1317]WGS73542.1 hypothetical protein OA858_05795 [Pseudanabaena galeata CCNP1313]